MSKARKRAPRRPSPEKSSFSKTGFCRFPDTENLELASHQSFQLRVSPSACQFRDYLSGGRVGQRFVICTDPINNFNAQEPKTRLEYRTGRPPRNSYRREYRDEK